MRRRHSLLMAVIVLMLHHRNACAVDPTADAAFQAVRSGDSSKLIQLLDQGTDVKTRNPAGATLLMYAAIYSDTSMLEQLLLRGADVNAASESGTTALMFAVSDAEKVRLLLKHGANTNVKSQDHLTPLIIASQIPGATSVVTLLLDGGADVNANADRYSPLMAATARGTPDTVRLLIRRGANVTAVSQFGFSPIHGASFNGTEEIARTLLQRGADANRAVGGFTPAMWAAVHGKIGVLKLLIEHGADINAQQEGEGTTALLWAATTDRADIIRLLLQHGADPMLADIRGHTPLTWAARSGATAVSRLLRESDSRAEQTDQESVVDTKQIEDITPELISTAVTKSLQLLQQAGPQFISGGDGCVSCHHQSLPAMAVSLAQRRGDSVDEKAASIQRDAVISQLNEMKDRLLQGIGPSDVLDPAVFLTALADERQPANPATDAAVFYLMNQQQPDGRWRNVQPRPPLQQSDIVNTAFGIRSLAAYGLPGRAVETTERIHRARQWLQANPAQHPTDEALRLLGLDWSGADDQVLAVVARRLLTWQQDDGGWSQLPTLPSDAYSTGIVLASLRRTGRITATSAPIQNGVRFLLQTQHDDGSWFVQTRSFPVQPYFESGFPHGESQFISITATAWATMALIESRSNN